jgi:hypothetical protein
MDGDITLDEIMSEGTAPEVIIDTTVVPTTTITTEGQARDDAGRFAPKAGDTDHDAQQVIEGQPQGTVPQQALHAAREKEREAREDAASLRRELAEVRGQVSLLATQRQEPVKPVEQAKPKAFWENPDDFLAERLAPVQQGLTQQKFDISRLLAEEKLGEDVVKAADDALGALMQANDPSVLGIQQRVMGSRHPYAELVKWHESHKAMSAIGNDPNAWQTQERERMRAELMAEYGIEAPAATIPAAQPSTTTKPLTKLPQSLSKLSGAGNGNGEVDASDAGIFTHAMAGR